jgi:hypothetical protein
MLGKKLEPAGCGGSVAGSGGARAGVCLQATLPVPVSRVRCQICRGVDGLVMSMAIWPGVCGCGRSSAGWALARQRGTVMATVHLRVGMRQRRQACQTSDGPLETGTTEVHAGTFLGRRYETQAICTDWTENKRFATKTISGPVYIEIDTTLAPTKTGTWGTSFYRGESRGFSSSQNGRGPTDAEALRDRREKPADAPGRRRTLLKAEQHGIRFRR